MNFHNLLFFINKWKLVGKIRPSRGIRQSNPPISPYISILCVEFLRRELVRQLEIPKSYRNGPNISFLMFAGDCIIFAKATPKACLSINKVLHNFCSMSGQLVNFHKSSVQISNNIQGAMKRRLREELNIPISNDISKYLGCPIFQGRAKRSTFFVVILKSQKKLATWKARFLSRVGKITLIKANLASSPHVMNCFKLTKRNNEDLDRINRNFLWQPNMGVNGTKSFPLIAWDDVYRPKFEEDLGIRKNEDVNKDSIAKMSWRILIDNDSFWARIIRDKYVKNNDFFRIPKKNGDSNV